MALSRSRCKALEASGAVLPGVSNSQKKVTEYFPTVYRDPSNKKAKRFKEIVGDNVQVSSENFIFFSKFAN